MSTISRKVIAGFLVAGSPALGAAYAAPDGFHGGFHGERGGGPMMHLRGLNLTEAQRDQIFKIFHDQAPAAREQMKQIRQARVNLAKAAGGDRYDDAGVRAAAEAQGKAVTQAALLRAQTMQRVREVLTPEQRAKLKERFEQRQQRR
jgi:periplasmic protein CpxP/Spy